MIWPFKNRSTDPSSHLFVFTDNRAFFKMHCKYGQINLVKNQAVMAIVEDAQALFDLPQAVEIRKDGIQTAILRVASEDGGFLVFAETAGSVGTRLSPNDIVLWLPLNHSAEFAKQFGDTRSGWAGVIVAKVIPEVDPKNPELKLECKYHN